jgi:hypothetical protein
MSVISSLIGIKVTVYSNMGNVEKQDVGVLEAVEQEWLRVRKADGETMFFCAYNVRMLRPFEPL